MKAGDVFDCTAKTEDGQDPAITVTQKDAQGNIEWELTSEMLNMDGLEPALREWLSGQGVEAQSIECPKARVIKAGSVFDCAVTAADGTSLTIEVTQDDDQGNVSWVIK